MAMLDDSDDDDNYDDDDSDGEGDDKESIGFPNTDQSMIFRKPNGSDPLTHNRPPKLESMPR